MENPITITILNDFIFCPASIYFHMLDSDTDKLTYQAAEQLNGTEDDKKMLKKFETNIYTYAQNGTNAFERDLEISTVVDLLCEYLYVASKETSKFLLL